MALKKMLGTLALYEENEGGGAVEEQPGKGLKATPQLRTIRATVRQPNCMQQ